MGFGLWKRLLVCIPLLLGCTRYRQDVDYDHPVEYSWIEPELSSEFSLFEGVAWQPGIVQAVHPWLIDQSKVGNQNILDLFSGPGVIAVTCAVESPKSVLSVAESEVAAACTRYNVAAHNQDALVTVRRVDWNAEPLLPTSDKFAGIIATLLIGDAEPDDAEPDDKNLDRRIAILLECVNGNLELGGWAIAVCQDQEVADRLTAAAISSGATIVTSGPSSSLLLVLEIKRAVATIAPPGEAVPAQK